MGLMEPDVVAQAVLDLVRDDTAVAEERVVGALPDGARRRSAGPCRVTVKTETLTANQAARRGRVLDAALELAAEGGYDAVQMRDVAARAQVALGTIYRYFASKDHLLAACQVELWRAQSDRLVDAAARRGRIRRSASCR